MKLIQPLPARDSALRVDPDHRIDSGLPLTFVKHRYAHHAAPSGYDRLCDYVNSPVVRVPKWLYWMGETIFRIPCLIFAKRSGKIEYQRYDCVLELEFLRRALFAERNRIYHFVYSEKSFHLTACLAGLLKKRGHRFVGTVHHMPYQMNELFRSLEHFRCFDLLLTMDEETIPFWQKVTGRDNVEWVPHGVDTDYFQPAEIRGRPQKKASTVLFAGTHERDFETLRKVIERCKDRGWQFVLIGKSKEVVQLGEDFEWVTQIPFVDDEKYREIIASSSVLFLPLLGSTVCNVVLEALACGVPVVTTSGGIKSYLDDSCAQVCSPGDAEAMVAAVDHFMQSGSRCASEARSHVEHFSWRQVAKRHLECMMSRFSGRNAVANPNL